MRNERFGFGYSSRLVSCFVQASVQRGATEGPTLVFCSVIIQTGLGSTPKCPSGRGLLFGRPPVLEPTEGVRIRTHPFAFRPRTDEGRGPRPSTSA